MRYENYQNMSDEQLAKVTRTALAIAANCQLVLEERGYAVEHSNSDTYITKQL